MISILLGTRPEIIKMSPIIRECEKRELDYNIIHSGQHYSENMDKVFFDQLELPKPDFNLNVGSGTQGLQTAKILCGCEKIFSDIRPDILLVQGDTNTVLAGALAASKMGIKIGHVEAGLRSYYKEMPEEINRILTDHCSDYLFAPTQKSYDTLINEGIPSQSVYITGNTVADSLFQNLSISDSKVNFKEDYLHEKNSEYFLATIHRKENVDDKNTLKEIMDALSDISKMYDIPVIYPIHPRSKKMIAEYNLSSEGITFVDPLDYLTFIQAEKCAKLILTDSGGVQEEACILGVPCVTIRNNTERPETVDAGANILGGTKYDTIINAAETMLEKKGDWNNPFGDGHSAEKIIDIIQRE